MLEEEVSTHCSKKKTLLFFLTPNHQRWYAKWGAQSEQVHVANMFLHICAPICMLSRCLVTKFLQRSSVKSLLRVRGWLGSPTQIFEDFFLYFSSRLTLKKKKKLKFLSPAVTNHLFFFSSFSHPISLTYCHPSCFLLPLPPSSQLHNEKRDMERSGWGGRRTLWEKGTFQFCMEEKGAFYYFPLFLCQNCL